MKINNLAQFKAAIKAAFESKQDIHTLNTHSGDFGIRKLSIVQTNAFAFVTSKEGKIVNSWCSYEKAGNYEFSNNNVVKVFWGEGDKREHILTYTFL